ncbi:hypothetical protein HYC85_014942 [Camellia sinensis]|uniref:Uncharacterized protein n=1 Tax=Camellia sinensis TaxID=4442 RepID=A0A7J7H8R4_CAMSI|nr:hypothetical protein HYC85_014942 [Camellia sinensis]
MALRLQHPFESPPSAENLPSMSLSSFASRSLSRQTTDSQIYSTTALNSSDLTPKANKSLSLSLSLIEHQVYTQIL